MVREICFDTETTGLKTEEGHRVIEIGCVELIDNSRTNNMYQVYLNPEREIPIESINIHGITNEFVADKPFFRDIADDFLNFIGDSILVAHNANFDMKFLNYELELCGRPPLLNAVVDSLQLAKKQFPGQKNNLDALCKRFNVDASKRTVHGALLDAELLADVYIELNGGAQKSFDTSVSFSGGQENMNFSDYLKSIKNNKVLQPRDFSISETVQLEHKKFINDKIKNNLWYIKEENS